MKREIVFILSLIIYASCGPNGERGGDNVFREVVETTQDRLRVNYLVFEGEIPCIDCDKIDVELWLEKDSVEVTSDYWIRTVHRNTAQGDVKLEVDGVYTKLRGYRDDPTATVYQLNPGTDNPRYFLLKDDGTLRVLGMDMQKLMEDDPDGYSYDLQLRRGD